MIANITKGTLMLSPEKVLKNVCATNDRILKDIERVMEFEKDAMEYLLKGNLYADFLNFQVKKLEKK